MSLLTGKPLRGILAFMLPLWIGNLIQQLYTVVDSLIVGRFLGVDALAAIGATSAVVSLLLGIAWSTTAGFAIVIASGVGAGRRDQTRRAFSSGLVITIALFISLAAVLFAFADGIIELLQVPRDVRDDASSFLRIAFVALPALAIGNYLTHTIRSLGNSRTPTIIFSIAGGLNAALAFLFVVGFGWGVPGAGWATAIAQLSAACLSALWIRRYSPDLLNSMWRPFARARSSFDQLRQGVAVGFQASTIAIGSIILQGSVNALGTVPVAAVALGIRIESFAMAPLASFGICLVTFCAQNRGAGQHVRVRVGVRQASLVAALAGGLIGVAFATLAPQIAGIFLDPNATEARKLVQYYLIATSPFYPLVALLFCYRGALQGLGRQTAPVLSGIAELVAKVCAAGAIAFTGSFAAVCFSGPASWFLGLAPVLAAWIWAKPTPYKCLAVDHPNISNATS